jgi:hypothetical protein
MAHRDLMVRLTEPQYHAVMSAIDMYYQASADTPARAALIDRAGNALSTAWTRAGDGF